jgi:hypothetical protein
MMRLASVLLVLTLLTTSMISGTFAKYTTSGTSSDIARVAKWGVVVTGGGSLYGKNYETGTESVPSVKTTAADLSVSSSDTMNVVAPGTKSGAGLSFSISGKPEVRTKVTVTISAQDIYLAAGTYAVMQTANVSATNFDTKKNAGIYTESNGTYTKVTTTYDSTQTYYELADKVTLSDPYYPVSYSNAANTDASDTKITGIATKIATNVAGKAPTSTATNTANVSYSVDKTVNPNVELGTELKLGSNTISWAWKITDTDADPKDTILGQLMGGAKVVDVASDGAATLLKVDSNTQLVTKSDAEVGSLKTSFNITITAEQVD